MWSDARQIISDRPAPLHQVVIGRGGDDDPTEIAVYLVDLREIDPPAGQKPLHWRLLTTAKVDDMTSALATADLYRRRWNIEQLFRTMKTRGFDVENIRIEDSEPRDKLVTADNNGHVPAIPRESPSSGWRRGLSNH